MAKVSLCMIVRNEEKILEKCLQSIHKIADEIIITDTGSTDRTVEIARRFTDQIKHFKWVDDFSAARNYCQKYALNEYVMTWDADNILEESALDFILKLKENDFNNFDLVSGTWVVEYSSDLRPIKKVSMPIFFRRDKFIWKSPIHNKLVAKKSALPITKVGYPEILFFHYKDREDKAHRYLQTKTLLERELAKNYKDPRLLFFYGESLMFDNDLKGAKKVFIDFLDLFVESNDYKCAPALEKIMLCNVQLGLFVENLEFQKKYSKMFSGNPIYDLTLADSVVACNFELSFKNYSEYNRKYIFPSIDDEYEKLSNTLIDSDRYIVHPLMMEAQHRLMRDEYEIAEKLLDYCKKHSVSDILVGKVDELIQITFDK